MFYELTDKQIEALEAAREKAYGCRRAGEGFGVSGALVANKLFGKVIGFGYGAVNGNKAAMRYMYGETSADEHEDRVERMRAQAERREDTPRNTTRVRRARGSNNHREEELAADNV